MVLDLNKVIVASYTSASGQTCRLQNPDVVVACQVELRVFLFVLLQHLLHFLQKLVFGILLLILIIGVYLLTLGFMFLFLLFLFLGFIGKDTPYASEFVVD
jgi:hypothetical protein